MPIVRHKETQTVAILKEHEAGVATKDLCRNHGISPVTFYAWKAKRKFSTTAEIYMHLTPSMQHDVAARLEELFPSLAGVWLG